MRILIDIGHPGHVHLFRPFATQMIKEGHEFLFTCRQKEFEIELLDTAGFKYKSFGKHYKSKLGKIWGLLKFDVKMTLEILKYKPDLLLSHGSMYAAHGAFLCNRHHVSFEDTGNMEQVRLYLPFTRVVLTPDVFHKNLGKKQIKYSSYHELAYLHPNIFNPDENIYKILGVGVKVKLILIRFISWDASHDVGQGGFGYEEKIQLVTNLTNRYNVVISSEEKLPVELEKFRLQTAPEKIHDVMSFASLFIGEGATMASECAVLGTPAIYVNTMNAGTIDDQEARGLLYHYSDSRGVLEKAFEILSTVNLKKEYNIKRKKLLKDKIDLTAYLLWFVKNYPKSIEVLNEKPEYQHKFK